MSSQPKHIMVSGSLAPQFPWTPIEARKGNGELELRNYWDGGLVDNTPLGDALEAFSDGEKVYRLLIVLNLYPLTGKEPKNLLGVARPRTRIELRQSPAAGPRRGAAASTSCCALVEGLEKGRRQAPAWR